MEKIALKIGLHGATEILSFYLSFNIPQTTSIYIILHCYITFPCVSNLITQYFSIDVNRKLVYKSIEAEEPPPLPLTRQQKKCKRCNKD